MRWVSVLVAIAIVLASACDSSPTEPTLESNVTVLAGAEVTTTDDAVLVGGQPRISFGKAPRGLYVQHFTEFSYGGLHQPVNDELVGDSWYMDVGRTITRENGDTIFYRFLDFGDVALEGTRAHHVRIDTVRVYQGGGRVRVYENGILNRVLIYSHRRNMDGTTVTFAHEPFYEEMIAGRAITVTASGSDDIGPTSGAVTLLPGARVTALSNGEPVDFERGRPVLRPHAPLVVELSRPLDPDRSLLYLAYAPPHQSGVDLSVIRRASVSFQLRERTNRVVIPAAALAEAASHLPVEEGEYVFRISEYLVTEDAMEIVRLADGTTESLSGLQVNVFGFLLRMRR